MKVVITGSSGFVGTELVKKCIETDISVICIDKNSPIDKLENNAVSYITSDITKEVMINVLKKEHPDAVIHLAAIRPIQTFTMKEYLINVEIAGAVMDACVEENLKNAIFISSRSVYSNEDMPWREDHSNIAINLYGEAKNAVDQLILFYNKYYKMCFKSLRLAQVLGTKEKKGFLLNTLIDLASRKETLQIYGEGVGQRQYIYVKDVVGAIIKACQKPEVEGIFNIGLEDTISIKDLALLINKVFDNNDNIVFHKEKPEDRKTYKMDVSKMIHELEFHPEYDMSLAIEDIKEELQNER